MNYLLLTTYYLLLTVVYLFFGLELGYTATSPWWTHVTYMFQHSGWLHLLLNAVAFYSLFGLLQRFFRPWLIVSVMFASAFGWSFVCVYPLPVVGSSGLVYAMLGMYFMLVSVGKIRYRNRFDLHLAIVSVATFLLISFLKHNSAGLLHLLCLISGYVTAFIIISFNNFIRKLNNSITQ